MAEIYPEVMTRVYDSNYGVYRDPSGDREFYLDLARAAKGQVLEIGCGTGRVLLPIARAGIPSVGIDLSPLMLEEFRKKDLPENLRLMEGDARDFDLGESRFALIYSAFRVFQHLVTVEDQLRCLKQVRKHLVPGGLFVVDFFAPHKERMVQEHEPEREDARFQDGDAEVIRYATITRDHCTQVQQVKLRFERSQGGALQPLGEFDFDMRWFYRYEVEHLLARSGFRVEALYGGFDKRPFDGRGEMIFVARAES